MSDLVKVNPQIVDAVTITNRTMREAAAAQGLDTVRQQIAQSVGLAIQDATDNLQQMLVLDSAVTGRAMAVLLSNPAGSPPAKQAEDAVKAIQAAVHTSIGWLTSIGTAAAGVVSGFPASPSGGS